MKNITKLKIEKPANEIFEAIVDPIKIGNFMAFLSSSERWEQGKTITSSIAMNITQKAKSKY